MIEYFIGFLGGIYITVLGFNFTTFVEIPWWIMIVLGILLVIGTAAVRILLVISDHRGMERRVLWQDRKYMV